jgi:sulfur carrier protein ThiS
MAKLRVLFRDGNEESFEINEQVKLLELAATLHEPDPSVVVAVTDIRPPRRGMSC